MSLYPTKTRLGLLRDIAEDRVFTDVTAEHARIVFAPNAPDEWQTQQTVTSRVEELEREGWIEEHGCSSWRLTDAGREVLDGAS